MARSFDGVNDGIAKSSTVNLPTTGTFSCLFYCKPRAQAAVGYMIEHHPGPSSNGGWAIYKAANDSLSFVKGTVAAIAGTIPLIENVWNVCGVIHRQTTEIEFFRLRLDTLAYASEIVANTSAIVGTINRLHLGAAFDETGEYDGLLAEAVIWNKDIGNANMERLIKAYGNYARYHDRSAVVLDMPLWGVADPEPDLSGNGNNGTVTGAVLADHAPVGRYTPSRLARVFPATVGAGPAPTAFFQHSGPLRIYRKNRR